MNNYSWLYQSIEHASHYLPAQAPLEVFVHHNTLHAFQDREFHQALGDAEARFDARCYLPEEVYLGAFARGRIQESDLEAALRRWLPASAIVTSPGFPGAVDLAKLVLRHHITPESRASLVWRMTERKAAEQFESSVAAVARSRIAHETEGWLHKRFVLETPQQWLPHLVGLEGTAEEQMFRFCALVDEASLPPFLPDFLSRNSVRLSVAALWQTCRSLSRTSLTLSEGSTPPQNPRSADERSRASTFPRDEVLRLLGDDPDNLVNPVLVAVAGAFLDRGQSRWSMPDRESGFFVAFCRILGAGHAVRPTWLATLGTRVRKWLERGTSAEGVVETALDELGIEASERSDFIEDTLLRLPGWAGMFHRLEKAPGPVGRSHARVRLIDFLAVRLVLDVLALLDTTKRLGYRGDLSAFRHHFAPQNPSAIPHSTGDHDVAWPLFLLAQHAGIGAPDLCRLAPDEARELVLFVKSMMHEPTRLRVWQEAFERRYREQLLRAVSANRRARSGAAVRGSPRFQVVFCIDDRFESFRRHFEEISPAHETLGAAGFYNVAIAYQGIDDPSTFPLCPVVVSPRHRIQEEPVSEHAERAAARRRWRRRMGSTAVRFDDASRSVFWGPFLVALVGILAALPLLAAVFAPFWMGTLRKKLTAWLLPIPKTRLAPPGESEARATDELPLGFTVAEKTERVGDLLENLGLVKGFAPVIALLGHDSESVNNPHFAAYSCGACGGRSGGPNARLWARMANRPEVRERLRERGIDIPDETVFVGGEYNTCTDAIELFDTDMLVASALPELEALEQALAVAAQDNARERCRRFASAPARGAPNAWIRHAEQRAFDLSQARPELGHATNAACIIGRRSLSYGVFLDRRAFLVSYDPDIDPEGKILERLLLAVIPVGAGINLEYFFSTVDNEQLGAGTKLPHNVVGLCGVMNGASSDLRTGLPKQMIEIHEPLRLQVVVESPTAKLLAIVERQPSLKELVMGAWVIICCVDPVSGALAVLDPRDGFIPWRGPDTHLPRVERSQDWFVGNDGFLPPALIGGADEVRDVA